MRPRITTRLRVCSARSLSSTANHTASLSRRLHHRSRDPPSTLRPYTHLQPLSMSSHSLPQRLIDFFDPSVHGKDPTGRKLEEVLAWQDQDLEYNHDYIQNVFPLPEGSMFNHAIWLVTPESFDAFRARPELRASLDRAFSRICAFYGLKNEDTSSGRRVSRASNFDQAKPVWLSRFNHNHLRITRILRSLRTLDLGEQAAAFHTFLETDPEVAAKISPRSKMYWKRAAERPLRLTPDEDDDNAKGIDWLRQK